jgi:DNA polymerase I
LSCQNPNLQNIPRTGNAPVKGIFVAPEGRVLIQADYSQIELRFGAWISGDANMLGLLRSGADLHTETARSIFGHDPSAEERTAAKTVNFGIFYGMGPGRLASERGMSMLEAQRFLREWHRLYPGIRVWQQGMEQELLEKGYVTSVFGRRRRLTPQVSGSQEEYKHILRMACNFPVQSAAAELTLMAGVNVNSCMQDVGGNLVCNVHDALIVEVPKKEEKFAIKYIRQIMEDPNYLCECFGYKLNITVPMPVEIKSGVSWGDLKGVE